MLEKLRIVIVAICTVAMAVLLFDSLPYANVPMSFGEKFNFDFGWEWNFNSQWKLKIEDDIYSKNTMLESGQIKIFTVKKKIPLQDFPKPYLSIATHTPFTVFLENKIIYEYSIVETIKNSKIRRSGNELIKLPSDCFGKDLTVKFYISNYLSNKAIKQFGSTCTKYICFGSSDYLLSNLLKKRLGYIIVTCFLFIICFFTYLVSITLKIKYHMKNYGKYLSAMILCVAIYILCEVNGTLFILDNVLTYYIKFIALFSIPILLYKYISFEYKIKNKVAILILSDLHLLILCGALIGQYTGIISFFQINFLFFAVFLTTLQICSYYIKNDIKKNKRVRIMFSIIQICFLSMLLDFGMCIGQIDKSSVIFSVIGSSIIGVYFLVVKSKRYLELLKAHYESMYLKLLLENQIKQYTMLEKRDADLRKIFHDTRNHWSVIGILLYADEVEQAKIYTAKMLDNLSRRTDQLLTTGNPILDAIITNKIQEGQINEIKIITEIMVVREMKINPLDYCIIFSNILDNAIEACKKVKCKDKYIQIKMFYSKEMLICKIANTIDSTTQINPEYKTTKDAHELHGFGIKNIKEAVSKYGGTVNICHDNEKFEISFTLFDI